VEQRGATRSRGRRREVQLRGDRAHRHGVGRWRPCCCCFSFSPPSLAACFSCGALKRTAGASDWGARAGIRWRRRRGEAVKGRRTACAFDLITTVGGGDGGRGVRFYVEEAPSKRLLVVIFGMQTVAPWEHLAWSRVLLETAATGAWLASGLPRVSSTRERDSCDVLGFRARLVFMG
jgi:hypothetical protein